MPDIFDQISSVPVNEPPVLSGERGNINLNNRPDSADSLTALEQGGDIFDQITLPHTELPPDMMAYGNALAEGKRPGRGMERPVLNRQGGVRLESLSPPAQGDIFDQITAERPAPVLERGKIPIDESPSFMKDVAGGTLKDTAGVITKAGAGLVKGATLGAVNPEEGTVGIPFTSKKWQVAPPLSEALKDMMGVSPEIADNPYVGMGPEMVGVAAPWSATSRAVETVGKGLKYIYGAKDLVTGAEKVSRAGAFLKGAGTRIAQQGVTGAIIGAAEVRKPEIRGKMKWDENEPPVDYIAQKGDSMVKNILVTVGTGAGLQALGEGVAVVGIFAKNKAFNDLKDSLSKLLYANGKAQTIEEADGIAAKLISKAVKARGGVNAVTRKQAKESKAVIDDLLAKTPEKPVFETAPVEPVNPAPTGAGMPPPAKTGGTTVTPRPETKTQAKLEEDDVPFEWKRPEQTPVLTRPAIERQEDIDAQLKAEFNKGAEDIPAKTSAAPAAPVGAADQQAVEQASPRRPGPDHPRGFIPTAEIWDKTPEDIEKEWKKAKTHIDKYEAGIEPETKKLEAEYKTLKKKKDYESIKRRKELEAQTKALKVSVNDLSSTIEKGYGEEKERFREDIKKRAAEKGIPAEDLDGFTDDFLEEISPNVDENYQRPISKVFDELLNEYITGGGVIPDGKEGRQEGREGLLKADTGLKSEIDVAAHEAATSPLNDLPGPTEAQKEAGNYKKGHVSYQGLDITIENPKGSERSGVAPDGRKWSTEMKHHYGYIKRTEGKDGDQVDVFIGEHPESAKVFVVNQVDPKTGKFDEHKALIGFQSEEAAREGYLSNYEKGWKGLGSMAEMSNEEFKKWVREGNTKKPVRVKKPDVELPSAHKGKTITIKTERGTTVQAAYALVEASDLVTLHGTSLSKNVDYPQELQPRERERAASELQINRILGNLEPEFLGESPKASEGAPIVGPDMVVESGNGRTIALVKGYESGHERMGAYKDWLRGSVEKFGIDPKTLDDFKAPVLVRVRQSDVDRVKFVHEANEQSVAAMSASEQAKADAESLTGELLSAFETNDAGEINTAANRHFIRGFLNKVVSSAEMGRYITSDGEVSQEGIRRIRNAVFAKAYGDPVAIEKLAEATDNNIKQIMNAMVAVGPKFAMLEELISKGECHDLSITSEIAQAAKKMSQLREAGQSFEDYLNQGALFDDGITALAKDIIGVFDFYKKSGKKIKEIFNNYVEAVDRLGSPKQESLFGDITVPTKADILQDAKARAEDRDGRERLQDALFEDEAPYRAEGKENDGHKQGGVGEGKKTPGSAKEGILREVTPVPAFFSQMQKVLERKLPGAGMPAQFNTIINNLASKGEFKAEELQWSGLSEWLREQQGKISREAVLDYLKANEIEIKEVTRGEARPSKEGLAARQKVFDKWAERINAVHEKINRTWQRENEQDRPALLQEESRLIAERDAEADAVYKIPVAVDTKYSKYTFPGGKDYRELLLTLPPKDLTERKTLVKRLNEIAAARRAGTATPEMLAEERRINARRVEIQNEIENEAGRFMSSHFDEPNVLAHVRFNERTDKDGKRVLFIEEVQSDWHQEGRKKGYKSGEEAKRKEFVDFLKSKGIEYIPAGEISSKILSEKGAPADMLRRFNDYMKGIKGVPIPDAPFKKTWHELTLKRMLRYAAENGYDRLAWTTGEQQADRYDLSKQVDSIRYYKEENGSYMLSIKKSKETVLEGSYAPNKLEEIVGKEVAEKIIKGEGKDTGTIYNKELSGLDLKVGGEGMKGFYDQILPAFLNKYARKWGARVNTALIDTTENRPLFMKHEFKGPIPTIEQVKKTYELSQSAGPNIYVSPITGRRLTFPLNRVANSQSLRATIKGMEEGRPFAELAVEHGIDPQIFGGEIVPAEQEATETKVHTIDITPSMKKSVLYEGQALFENLERYHPEYKNDQKNRRIAETALNETGRFELSFGRRENTASDRGEASGGVRTLGVGITAELAQKGYIDLRGRKAETAHDIAVAAQVYRNPQYEAVRYIYVKNGVIVAHEGRTSRLPGMSIAFVKDTIKELYETRQRMKRLGADGMWIVHNHPSGDPRPSGADRAVTKVLYKNVPGLKGHIIIDSNKYAAMTFENGDLREEVVDMATDDGILRPYIDHPLLGVHVGGAETLAQIARALKTPSGFIVAVYRDAKGLIRAVQELPAAMANDRKALTDYLRGRGREFGSTSAFIAVPSRENLSLEQEDVLVALTQEGTLSDTIFETESVMETTGGKRTGADTWMGAPVKGMRVSEEGIAENIAHGREAMEKVIKDHVDVKAAMQRPELGPISFYWGKPGNSAKGYKDGNGVSHIIARRNAEGHDGVAEAKEMVAVIANGTIGKPYGPKGGERVNVSFEGDTAVLSKYRFGKEEVWLLTGWPDDTSGGTGGVNPARTYAHQPSGIRDDVGAEATFNKATTPDAPPVKEPPAQTPEAFRGLSDSNISPDVDDVNKVKEDEAPYAVNKEIVKAPEDPFRLKGASHKFFHPLGLKDPDLSKVEALLSLPWHMGKRFKEYYDVLTVELNRQARREQLLHRFLEKTVPAAGGKKNVHEFLALPHDQAEELFKVMIVSDMDNKVYRSAAGRGDENAPFLQQKARAILGKELTDKQVEAYYAWNTTMQKALNLIIAEAERLNYIPYDDFTWIDQLKAVARGEKTIEQAEGELSLHDFKALQEAIKKIKPFDRTIRRLRRQTGRIKYYVPRVREQGDYTIRVLSAKGSTVWYEKAKTEREAFSIKARLEKEFPGKEIEAKIEKQTPESLYQAVSEAAIERFIEDSIQKFKKRVSIGGKSANEMRDAMLEVAAEHLKARGFGQHMISRLRGTVIGGYQTENGQQIFTDYLSGMAGFITKQEAAYRFSQALETIPLNKPYLFEEVSGYVKDMLRNTTALDRRSGVARSLAFTYYLAGNLKSATVQLTQNFVTGIPVLSRHTKGATAKYIKAMSDVIRGNMSAEEASALYEALDKGVASAQYIDEVTGQLKGQFERNWRKFIDTLSWPFSMAEIFNRKSAFLAMYRVAKNEQKWDHAEAFRRARDFVYDTHYLMGKANLPSWARGATTAHAIGRTAYTFRSYNHNYLASMIQSLAKQPDGKRHLGVLGRSLAWLMVFGGLTAIPWLDDLLDLLERLTGTPYRSQVRDMLKGAGGKILEKVGTRGLPALLGVDLSGSIKIGLPSIGEPTENIYGVYGGLWNKAVNGFNAFSSGQVLRGVEAVSPAVTENILKGYRMYTEGATNLRGKTYFDEKGKPVKLSPVEAVAQAAGFRPARAAAMSQEKQTLQNMKSFYSDWKDDIYTKFRTAKTGKERQAVIKEVQSYNRASLRFKGAIPKITMDSLMGAAKEHPDKAFMRYERAMDAD